MAWRSFLLGLAMLAGCKQVFGLDSPARQTDLGNDADVDSMPATDALDALVDASVDMLPDTPPPPVSASVMFQGVVTSGDDVSTYSFTGRPIGTASLDRHIIAVTHGRSPTGGYFTNAQLTIDGVAMIKVVETGLEAATTAIFIAPKSTGTTADFVLTYAGGTTDRRALLAVYAAYGLESANAADTEVFQVDNTNPGSLMITVPAGGIVVTGVSMSSVTAGTSSSWTGLTERYNQNVESSVFSGGSALGTGTTQTHTHSSTDAQTSQRMASASFR